MENGKLNQDIIVIKSKLAAILIILLILIVGSLFMLPSIAHDLKYVMLKTNFENLHEFLIVFILICVGYIIYKFFSLYNGINNYRTNMLSTISNESLVVLYKKYIEVGGNKKKIFLIIVEKIFKVLNIQVLIIFSSIGFILYSMKEYAEYQTIWIYTKYMLLSSIINLVINIVLYILFLVNRVKIERSIRKEEINDIDFVCNVKTELNYILYSLIVFTIYSITYFLYFICVAFSQ